MQQHCLRSLGTRPLASTWSGTMRSSTGCRVLCSGLICILWLVAEGRSAAAAAPVTPAAVFYRPPWKAIKLKISSGNRDGYLLVPPTYSPRQPSPMLVLLHEAFGSSSSKLVAALAAQEPLLRQQRCLLLVPESKGRTWDVIINGEFGADAQYITSALKKVLASYNVDPKRIGLVGFSDGATYALTLGLPLSRVFNYIIAFSPGDMAPPSITGNPKVFVSHGVNDDVLDINLSSRRILPRLKQLLPQKGQVQYTEFKGKHIVPPAISLQALTWFLTGKI